LQLSLGLAPVARPHSVPQSPPQAHDTMGCLLDKDPAGQPQAHQPSAYGGQPVYAQRPHAYGQQPAYGEQPAYGQAPSYGQPPPTYAPGPQWQAAPKQEPQFMRMAAPNGASWAEYVKTGGRSYVDPGTGFLAGPWAECISWGVRFEHTTDWRNMPEYIGQEDGPVGGILSALEASTKGHPDGYELLEAANRLEEASHAAEEEGRPLPGLQQSTLVGRPVPSAQSYHQLPAYGQQPLYGQQPPFEQAGPYGQPGPFGQPSAYCEQPMYGQAPAYGESAGWGAQQPYHQQQPGIGGPTLLQQQAQSQGGGMGTGAKVAMAAVGGICAGAGALYVADHMDEVGQALGGAGEWVAGAAEDVGGFVGDVADDIF